MSLRVIFLLIVSAPLYAGERSILRASDDRYPKSFGMFDGRGTVINIPRSRVSIEIGDKTSATFGKDLSDQSKSDEDPDEVTLFQESEQFQKLRNAEVDGEKALLFLAEYTDYKGPLRFRPVMAHAQRFLQERDCDVILIENLFKLSKRFEDQKQKVLTEWRGVEKILFSRS